MMWPLMKSSLPSIAFAMGGLGGMYMNYRIVTTGIDEMYRKYPPKAYITGCFGSAKITPQVYRRLFENKLTKPGE